MTERQETGVPEGPAPGARPAHDAGPEASPATPPAAPRRRAYATPRLQSLGRLSRVTRFGGSEIVDSGSGLGQQV